MARSAKRAPKPRASAAVDAPLRARQERSQATTEGLLEAAEALLREGGADAATLRAIADRAGVSLGIVYRRFPDKDAVLRAVYTRFFERTAAINERSLASEHLRHATLGQLSAALVRGIAEGYRLQRPLLRALVLYARTHPDAEFRKRAAALNAATFASLESLFAVHAGEISHRNAAVAIPFAIAAIGSVLQDRLLFNDLGSTPALSHQELIAEATRMFQGYLGAAAE